MPPASSTLMRQIIPFSEKIIFSSLYLAVVSITNNKFLLRDDINHIVNPIPLQIKHQNHIRDKIL